MIKYIDTNKIEIPEGFFNDLNVPKFFQWLNDLPTADVEEVKHGKWIDYSGSYDRGMDLRCSVCNMRASSFVHGSEDWWDGWKPNYRLHCGVRMDDKEKRR